MTSVDASAARDDTTLHHFADDLLGTGIQFCFTGIHGEVGILRGFVGGGDAGELGDLPGTGFFVEALCVAIFTDFDGSIAIDFDEVAMLDHAAHALAVGTAGGDEGGQHNHTRLHEQLGHFADAADVFLAVCGRETEVAAQAVAHVVAIQHEGATTLLVQGFFDGMGKRGFARTGQSGKPYDCAAMAVLCLTARTGDGGVVPDNVRGKVQGNRPKVKRDKGQDLSFRPVLNFQPRHSLELALVVGDECPSLGFGMGSDP